MEHGKGGHFGGDPALKEPLFHPDRHAADGRGGGQERGAPGAGAYREPGAVLAENAVQPERDFGPVARTFNGLRGKTRYGCTGMAAALSRRRQPWRCRRSGRARPGFRAQRWRSSCNLARRPRRRRGHRPGGLRTQGRWRHCSGSAQRHKRHPAALYTGSPYTSAGRLSFMTWSPGVTVEGKSHRPAGFPPAAPRCGPTLAAAGG